MTIILTNPDVVLYRGEDQARIMKELEDFETLKAAGMLVDREIQLSPSFQNINRTTASERLQKVADNASGRP